MVGFWVRDVRFTRIQGQEEREEEGESKRKEQYGGRRVG